MNIEKIGEPICVLAEFSGGQARPVEFQWGGRTYPVSAVNARWVDRGGEACALCYSVQVGQETYYIRFSSTEVQWWLDQIVVE